MNTRFKHILFSSYTLLALAILAFGLSYVFNSYYPLGSTVGHEKNMLTQYVQEREQDFNDFVKDTSLLRKLLDDKETKAEFDAIAEKKDYGIFLMAESVFEPQQLLFWNKQDIPPSPNTMNWADGEYFDKLDNGYYVIIKRSFSIRGMSNRLWAYALIPIKHKYYLENEYLTDDFVYSKNASRRIIISSRQSEYPIKSTSGKNLFYIERRANTAIPYNDTITVILRLLALCFFFVFAHSLAESIAKKTNQPWKGVLTLVTILLITRLVIYFFPSIFQFRQFGLFDPSIYGTDSVNATLGDLLINSLIFSWITVFTWSKLGDRMNMLRRFSDPVKWIVGTASLLFLVLSTFTLANIIKSLVADSQISFDVTSFFSLTKFTVVGFIVLASLSLGYYYFSQLMFRFILPVFEQRKALIYFGIGVTGLIYLSFRAEDPAIQFYIPVLLWLICYTWLVSQRGFVINRFRINIAGILFWIFIFSVSIAVIIIGENKDKEWENRKAQAALIADQDNTSVEMMLSVTNKYLDNRFLSQNFHRFYEAEAGKVFRDSIISMNTRSQSNNYDTKLYVFDSLGTALNNSDDISFEALNNIISMQASESKLVPGLYSYIPSSNKINYITKREVVDTVNKKKLGTVFLFSNPRSFTSNALETTLFKQPSPTDPRESQTYSYAIYEKDTLKEYSAKYPFATTLKKDEKLSTETDRKTNGDYDELWYRQTTDRYIVLARKRDSLIEAITLFSYIFCSFLFLVTFIQTLSFFLRMRANNHSPWDFFQMNIRTQVHGTIIFISILSFLIIGAATISFFIERYSRNNNDKLSRTMNVLNNELKKRITNHSIFDDQVKIYEPGANSALQKLVNEVADIHNVDVNIYDPNGMLAVSSQENIYEKGVLGKQINPIAYYHLSRLREVERVQKEKIANLKYLSIYAPVRSDSGVLYGYVNIPYFLSEIDLNQEISNFLVTIINLNAFIFLIAGVVALFITNRITRSFSLIGEKMREVNLGKMNEEIKWYRNDEIGELVKEYNKMVSKLGESAEALAKSEREGAWREMARQVAHEIKNPLTPMKLSIQYLQKAILNNSPDVKDLTAKVANTLVEQIDHLSKIAFDFSQFANIGNTQVETFDMHDVLGSLTELYQRSQQVDMRWHPVHESVMLRADKTQMNRLFTNLFQNAVEASNGKGDCIIEVNELRENGSIKVSVKDNGEGIPSSMHSKIFAPNFTTKSSGTGLGLAMCKSIVEQTGGKIWFETMPGVGTTFHVELPVIES